MDIIEKLIAGHRDIKEREDILRKLVKMIDTDTFFWDNAAKVSHFLDTEVRDHFALEEKVLFPVLKTVVSADKVKVIDDVEGEHRPIIERIDEFKSVSKGHLEHPSKFSRQQIVHLASEILDRVIPHAEKEDEVLFRMIRESFSAEDYRRLETQYFRHIGV